MSHTIPIRTSREPASSGPPEPARQIRPGDPAITVFHAALGEGSYWLGVNAPRARDGDPEGVHHLRTTSRRIRTALALFRSLTEADWADQLEGEFAWLADLLGNVRDIDVMTEKLIEVANTVDSHAAVALSPLFEELHARHQGALKLLREGLSSDRFARMVDEVATASDHLPISDNGWKPCRTVMPSLVQASWRKLRRDARELSPNAPDEAFHEVRKRAKRARYAAEAVRAALDRETSRDAGRFARRARAIQDILGAHQDAVVAAEMLKQAADNRPQAGAFNFAAGRVMEAENRIGTASRSLFFEAWAKLDRKKNVRWLSG